MHESAKKYGKAFFETYCSNNFSGKKVVDVGAQDVNGSLREFCPEGASYIGVDFVEGKGVDVILTDPYKLPFEDESVDVIVCSSVFEHSEFFWLLFLECLRIIKSDGLLYLNAPSNGYVHRYPMDSWRFYPDAGRSLINWSRRNAYNAVLLESFVAEKQGHIAGDGMWNDFIAVILKDQSQESLYPHRMLREQGNIYFGYSSDRDNDYPLIVQNPDHCLITEQQGRIVCLNQLVSDQDVQIAGLAQEIAALRNSTSWRLTKPLRFVAHQIARGKHLVRITSSAFRMGGGPRETLKKAIGLYRREGFSGLKRGIRIVQTGGEIKPGIGSDAFDRNDYAEWVRRYDTIDDAKRQKCRTLCDGLASKPKISVVMPTYNSNPEWLIEAIESVRNQIYPNWELCIADDASPDSSIRPILERYAREDKRIKVVFREHNGHISAASNSALEMATGEWTALLEHDDLLAEHALFWVADAINQNPEARLVYSDEDKIDKASRRLSPYFKCDWNVNLFYSHNMFSHLGVYHTILLRQIGGFRLGLEGSQDYDLALRCIERIKPSQIHHVPRVLYHWRMHAESTAHSAETKPYAMLAGERALNEHFQRQNIDAKAKLVGYGYRVRYALPEKKPLVSLIIPTRNGLQLIKQCIESIRAKTTYKNFEILVIDNGSDDPDVLNYFASFDGDSKVRVIRDDSPFNYSALNNRAVLHADGEFVGLLNNDVEVISPEWLDEMLSLANQPGKGAIGACLWYPNETLQHGGVITGLGGVAGHSHKHLPRGACGHSSRARLTQGMSAVTAACLIIKKSIYLEVGGLNEADLQVAFNDVDFCLKVREAGYQNVWTPFAELYHHESATRGFDDTPEKQARFSREVAYMKSTWGASLLNDPAYSPNLTLDHDDFSLAWPPRGDPLLPFMAVRQI